MIPETAEAIHKQNIREEPDKIELILNAVVMFPYNPGLASYFVMPQLFNTIEMRSFRFPNSLFNVTDGEWYRILRRCDAIDAHAAAQK